MDFIEEQIEQAKRNPTEQYVAVDAARGVIPLMAKRLAEDNDLKTVFMLVFDQQVSEPWWREWWENFAKSATQEFAKEADRLLSSITALRQSLTQNAPLE